MWAPKIASTELLGCVHTEEYLSNFISGQISEKDQRRTGFPWSSGLVQRCRYETGMLFSMCFKSRCEVNHLGHILLENKNRGENCIMKIRPNWGYYSVVLVLFICFYSIY